MSHTYKCGMMHVDELHTLLFPHLSPNAEMTLLPEFRKHQHIPLSYDLPREFHILGDHGNTIANTSSRGWCRMIAINAWKQELQLFRSSAIDDYRAIRII